MTRVLNGILYARDLPVTPEIALFISSGNLSEELSSHGELHRPLVEEAVDPEIPSDDGGFTHEDAQWLPQLSQTPQCIEQAEAAAHRGADVASDDSQSPSNRGTKASGPSSLGPESSLRPSDEGVPPHGSEASHETAEPVNQGLTEALAGSEGALLECLNQQEPLRSIADFFDLEAYEKSTTVSSAGGLCRSESCASVSTCDWSYCTSAVDGDQPEKASGDSEFDHTTPISIIANDEEEIVLLDVRPVTRNALAEAEDDDVTMVDAFAFEPKKKAISKAARKPRRFNARTRPYDRATARPVAARRSLRKWVVFVEEWPQIEEAFERRPELRDRLACVRGYVELVEQDFDFDLWKGPLLEQWELLKEAVKNTDEESVVSWVEGMLIDVFNSRRGK